MKAVLVIDMPESCCACYLSSFYINNYEEKIIWCPCGKCRVDEYENERADFCPLKAVPDNFEIDGGDNG